MSFILKAVTRKAKGEKAREGDGLPAVVYGSGGESVSINISQKNFLKLYKEAGESSLIDLELDEKDAGKTLVQDVQHDPVSGRIIHVDLRRIDMSKPITAMVPLNFINEAPVIKASGGTLVRNLEDVEVECLPKDLVSHLDVDLSVLTSFDEVIKVKNLVLPAGMVIVSPNAEDLVAKASAALTEDEIKAMETSATDADISKIEVAGKKESPEDGAENAEDSKEKAE